VFIFGSAGVLFSRRLVPNFQFEICPAHLNRKVTTKLMTGRAALLAVVRPAVERRRFR
jgi:hypothetical protein